MKSLRMKSYGNGLAMLFFAGLGLLSCSGEKSGDGGERYQKDLDLSGDVKSLTEITYANRNKSGMDTAGEASSKIKYLFNKDGKTVEQISYRNDFSRWTKTIYTYNPDGTIAGNMTVDNDLDLLRRTIFKYDGKGRVIEKIDMNHVSEIIDRETYRYYRKTNEVEKFIIRPASPSWNIYLQEDSTGGYKSVSRHDISGPYVLKVIFKNDKNGNRIEERYFKPDGSPGTKYLNKYDSRGNIIETTVYNSADTLIFKSVFKYDDSGNLTEKYSGDSDEELKLEASYAYNEMGSLTEVISDLGLRSAKYINSYTYDQKGNWITRIRSEVSAKTGIIYSVIVTKRYLEYFQ